VLAPATTNIEFLTRQVVQSVGDPITKATVEFYDFPLGHEVVRDLAAWNLRPSPKSIVAHETFEALCGNKVEVYPPDSKDESSLTCGPPYRLSQARLKQRQKEYSQVRAELLKRLKERGISVTDFVSKT
jgi:hypothetical protein